MKKILLMLLAVLTFGPACSSNVKSSAENVAEVEAE